jgi:cytochrome c553
MRTLLHAAAALVVLLADALLGTSRSDEDVVRAPIVRFVVKHPWLTAAGLAAVVVTGAALIVVSGIMPIKASSGHWPITARLLDFAKLRSVATHSLGIQAPPLDDEALVLRGAAHYENGCSSCHGKPGAGMPPVMAAMTPEPPELPAGLSRYKPEELFSIVKHGIKFTGMPAWPAQERDDEVWAVVSFLRRMPRLDAAAYQRLAYGELGIAAETAPSLPLHGQQPPPAVRDICWRCHGVDGTGRGPGAFPSLAGQRSAYLYASLRAFAHRTRFSGIMSGIAATLSDGTMREVAAYYERLPPREAEFTANSSAIMRGMTMATRGIPGRDIPACGECHGPSERPKNPAYPRLSGQHARYLTSQLELLKKRHRGGTPNVNLMHVFVDRLNSEAIRDVTLYFATLPKE